MIFFYGFTLIANTGNDQHERCSCKPNLDHDALTCLFVCYFDAKKIEKEKEGEREREREREREFMGNASIHMNNG